MNTQESSPFLPEDSPTDPQAARRSNRNRIMRSIITRGPATRADLARRTGLSRPTVSVIANELLTTGVLAEGARVSSGGAPGTLLEISRDTGVTIAADLRIPGHLRMGTVTASGEVIETRSLSTPTTAAVSEALIDFSRQLTSDAILGIALGVQGWVNAEGEWIEDLEESVDPKIMLDLRKTLRVPVFALNSTDAMTLSDLRDSPAGLSAQATIAMDSRISAGLVIGGRLRTGVYRPAGDIAHIVTGPSGPQCPKCGQPCLNASIMPLTADQSAPAQQLAAQALGTVMAPIAAAVELDEIVLAGFPGPVAQPMAQQTHSEMLLRMPREQMPSVRVSERGADAVLVGSAAMMLYRRLA